MRMIKFSDLRELNKKIIFKLKNLCTRTAELFESGEGRGGLTSDSKWGAENTFSQQLLIIFKKVGVAEAPPPSSSPPRVPAGALQAFSNEF